MVWVVVTPFLTPFASAAEIALSNAELLIRISSADGSYTIGMKGATSPVLRARIAAEVDHHWVHSTDYPKHEIGESSFEDSLGRGHQAIVTSTGLSDRPDLSYTIRVYDNRPFGDIEVQIRNHSARPFEVQSIRSIEAVGEQVLNLHASSGSDRVLSDSFSEDWPPLRIYDLGKSPNGMHRAVGSQLV
jgi:hypothetical protein